MALKNRSIALGLLIPLSLLSIIIHPTSATKQNSDTGELLLVANGEDFVRQGFTSKDGWQIEFDHVYVTLAEVTAYQTNPPFDPATDEAMKPIVTVVLTESPQTVDLAEGDTDAKPILVSQVKDAPAGNYNAIAWQVVPSTEGKTILLQGKATKGGETINFNLGITQALKYTCGEFVGDDRKGILEPGAQAELETTFHFDHIFGSAEVPQDDPLNTDALGFEPLAALAQNGQLQADSESLAQQMSPEDYQRLAEAIANLGHVGEGHCRRSH
ncbi:hypothetical protein [Gloeocapsa sp. PCC 73106]|uniref:hypothetical protein n=1 Tax=Gloeocapsa sp. PCC 73106 TaxID=102232 RepID=UPI0002ACB20C|nr:hypothetical protein [Gloeocapsa sp. PCC 73106]ELR98466.1 hypothetical protein GLO73106DRAFT_00022990 [Gloeocapsa sp. PCC 73106]